MSKCYLKAIEILGEKIAKLEDDIYWRDYEIKELKAKLKAAEEAAKSETSEETEN